ncbi:hypothetical protein EVAR_14288_1 [Eumeta japonica]|uniref:Uncharacterized protein n=1 Tax=Eumeta variegata TaxID=151549 RepID=A0A4C1UMZ8_EUMVA|nr:hypothetical protein EVAR_14288_1 [Eumeta japonica]
MESHYKQAVLVSEMFTPFQVEFPELLCPPKVLRGSLEQAQTAPPLGLSWWPAYNPRRLYTEKSDIGIGIVNGIQICIENMTRVGIGSDNLIGIVNGIQIFIDNMTGVVLLLAELQSYRNLWGHLLSLGELCPISAGQMQYVAGYAHVSRHDMFDDPIWNSRVVRH